MLKELYVVESESYLTIREAINAATRGGYGTVIRPHVCVSEHETYCLPYCFVFTKGELDERFELRDTDVPVSIYMRVRFVPNVSYSQPQVYYDSGIRSWKVSSDPPTIGSLKSIMFCAWNLAQTPRVYYIKFKPIVYLDFNEEEHSIEMNHAIFIGSDEVPILSL